MAALAGTVLLLGASTAAAVTLHALTPKGCFADVGDAAGCGATAQGLFGGFGIAASPDGDSVYAVATADDAITRFDRSPGGALSNPSCIADVGDTAGCGATANGLNAAFGVTVSPDGANVYTVGTVGTITRFDRSPGGALSNSSCIADVGDAPGCGTTAQGLNGARGVAVSPDGESVYTAASADDAIVRFDRSPGGALSNPSCIADVGDAAGCGNTAQGLDGVRSVTVSPDGDSVYAVGSTDDAIVRFDRSPGGALSNPSCIADVGDTAGCGATAQGLNGVDGVAISPDAGSVYAVTASDRAIVRFDRSAGGALSNSSCISDVGDPAGCGTTAQGLADATGVAVSGDGQSVYAATAIDNAIVRFDRSAGGALSNSSCISDVGDVAGCGATAQGLNGAVGVAVSPDSASVYTVSTGDRAVARFDRELAPVCRSTSSTGEPGVVQTVALDCSDPNGDPVEIEIVKGPANGTLGAIDQLAGTVAYAPDGGFSGADSFDIQATSDGKHSNTSTVVVAVQSATGPQGPSGTTGPAGPPGPPGPPGSDSVVLAAAIAADTTKAKGRSAKVRVVTTLPGSATLEAAPKGGAKRAASGKRAKTRTATQELATAGRHTLKLRKLTRGASYGLTLSVESRDGQEAVDTAKLKVKKGKR